MSQANSNVVTPLPSGLTPRNSTKKPSSFDFENDYHNEVMARLDKSSKSSHSVMNGSNRLCDITSILESSNMLVCRACVEESKLENDVGLDKDLESCLKEVTNGPEKLIATAFVQRFKRKRKSNNKRRHNIKRVKEKLSVIDQTIGMASNTSYQCGCDQPHSIPLTKLTERNEILRNNSNKTTHAMDHDNNVITVQIRAQ